MGALASKLDPSTKSDQELPEKKKEDFDLKILEVAVDPADLEVAQSEIAAAIPSLAGDASSSCLDTSPQKPKLPIVLPEEAAPTSSFFNFLSFPKAVRKMDLVCKGRLQKDIARFFKEPPPGIFIYPNEADIKHVYALMIGPKGTPYEGGFFNFHLLFPDIYPHNPPKVRLLTTSEGRVRFNPNLYCSGKVCLSILGTWKGPCWSPALSLTSVLISIQSLLNDNPYYNEPGYGKSKNEVASKNYNDCIVHETIRVAVCEMLEGKTADTRNMPEALKAEMENAFPKHYKHYKSIVENNNTLDSKQMKDPFKDIKGKFNYASLKRRLEALALKFPEKSAKE